MTEAKILVRFALRLTVSEIQSRHKSEMHRMIPTKNEDLTVKSTLYTLTMYPWCLHFGPFRSTTSRFRDRKSPKIGNAPNGPKLNLNTTTSGFEDIAF